VLVYAVSSARAVEGVSHRHRSVRRIVFGERVARVARYAVLTIHRGGDLEQVVWDGLRDHRVIHLVEPARALRSSQRGDGIILLQAVSIVLPSVGGRLRDHRASLVILPFHLASCDAASNAAFSIGGNSFPLRSARLKIPLQAFGESEYFSGSGPVSKTSDNEDTSPALRNGSGPSPHSHVLSVKHPVGPPIPELTQRPEEGAKIPSSPARQNTGDIFPHEPFRAQSISDCQVGEHEISAWVGESLSQPGDAE
jgi:hypothetical protein